MSKIIEGTLESRLLLPGSESYEAARKVWNGTVDKKPAAIAVCETAGDVVAAVTYANKNDLSISIRGGGHHVAGFAVCDGGLMIDLSKMRKVQVDVDKRIVEVEGGALLGDVDKETQKFGLATPTGTISETGIAGLALSGGLGYLRGNYGLTSDNLVEAHIVTASGQSLVVNQDNHPDLFWALRGGGGNFGVVTKFAFKLYEVGPEVLAADLIYDFKDAKQIFKKSQAFIDAAPDKVSFNLGITQLPPLPFLPEFLHNRKVIILQGMYAGNPNDGEDAIQPLRELATPIVDQSGVLPYTVLQSKSDAMVENGIPVYGTSLYLSDLNDEKIDAFLNKLESVPSPGYMAQIWGTSGQMNRVPEDETPFAVRDADFVFMVDVMAVPGVDGNACQAWVDALFDTMLPFSHRQTAYLNGIVKNESVMKNAFAGNYDRLVEIKRKYDPNNLFRHNHNINPNE